MENTTNPNSNANAGKGSTPFSLRLTFAERSYLEEQAAGMPLSAYVRVRLFGDTPSRAGLVGGGALRKKRKSPVKDHQALAQVLACLGASRIANRLNALTGAIEAGNHIFSDQAELHIEEAKQDIEAMRLLLMQALGMRIGHEVKESLSQIFTRAAAKPDPFGPPHRTHRPKARLR